jgi:hypothetical protein
MDQTKIPRQIKVAVGDMAGNTHETVAMEVPTSIVRRVGQRRVR